MQQSTVSTKEAAFMLGVSEQVVRRRIDAGDFAGVTMASGCWRIPVRSIPAGMSPVVVAPNDPPPYVLKLIDRLSQFDTGTIPCAEAAQIAGIGVKAMRSALRSGRIPGGRLVGGCWLVTVADFGRWLGVSELAS